MVQIKLHNNVLPIDFGEFQLEFVANDENYELLQSFYKDINADDFTETENFLQLRDLTNKAFDTLFGEGTFDRVYRLANQSSSVAANYLTQVVMFVNQEYQKQSEVELIDSKYYD